VEVLKDSKKEVEDSRMLGIDKGKCMFAELAKKYDEIFAKKQKGYSTKKYIIRQLVDEFGSFKIRALDVEAIERYQTKFLSTHKPATTNRLIACLKHMITKAVDWDMASEDTLRRIRKVKNLAESNKRIRFLNVNECQRLIECCASHLKPIVITALNTGMRKGEILTLKWEQIDLLHGYITWLILKAVKGEKFLSMTP
jgi:integrase